jgi:hypothetical protein
MMTAGQPQQQTMAGKLPPQAYQQAHQQEEQQRLQQMAPSGSGGEPQTAVGQQQHHYGQLQHLQTQYVGGQPPLQQQSQQVYNIINLIWNVN